MTPNRPPHAISSKVAANPDGPLVCSLEAPPTRMTSIRLSWAALFIDVGSLLKIGSL